MARAYLDHASSSPLRPVALQAMLPYLRDHPADPGRLHQEGRVTRVALEVAVGRTEGAGAGRPSKHYRVPADAKVDLSGAVSVRSDDLVLSLLGRALALLPREQAEQMAEAVGQEYGRAMAHGLTGDDLAAGQRSLRSAIQAVADALTAHGFAAHADQRNNQLRIINHHCPFGDVAIENPVICAVDRGMVKGMLAALYGDADVNTLASLPQGDTFCDVGLTASR